MVNNINQITSIKFWKSWWVYDRI